MMLKLRYRARYYWRRLCHALGYCPACFERVNVTPAGAVCCPFCRQR